MADAAIEGMHERQAHLVDTGHTAEESFGLSEAVATFPPATEPEGDAAVATMVELTASESEFTMPETPEEDL
jgi:hypothetical protein